MDESSKRVAPHIAAIFQNMPLAQARQYVSGAYVDESCRERDTEHAPEELAASESERAFTTGVLNANANAIEQSDTERGALTTDGYPTREQMLADPVIAGRVAVMRMARK